MKLPLIRKYGSYFPRLSGSKHMYAQTIEKKNPMEIDVKHVTIEEKKNHKKVLNAERRKEREELDNLPKKRAATETQFKKTPISFSNL